MKTGDLAIVEGWKTPAMFVGWTDQCLELEKKRGISPEFGNFLVDGNVLEVHIDYVLAVKQQSKGVRDETE